MQLGKRDPGHVEAVDPDDEVAHVHHLVSVRSLSLHNGIDINEVSDLLHGVWMVFCEFQSHEPRRSSRRCPWLLRTRPSHGLLVSTACCARLSDPCRPCISTIFDRLNPRRRRIALTSLLRPCPVAPIARPQRSQALSRIDRR